MDARELMRLHVRALFTQDADGHLKAVNEPGGPPAPRLFLGRTEQGNLCWVRHDVDAPVAAELHELCEGVGADLHAPHPHAEKLIARLARDAPVERVWSGPAYECPRELPGASSAVRITPANAGLLSPYLEEWRVDAEAGVPMTVSLRAGDAVSVCCSVRVGDRAHEAGVETHADFRGRGHGSRAVSGWAAFVRSLGLVPLYSTSWENRASLALAARLDLRMFGADLHIT